MGIIIEDPYSRYGSGARGLANVILRNSVTGRKENHAVVEHFPCIEIHMR
jgi:hypothetical protein